MIKKLINNNYFKSILTLSTGSLLSQIITFISAPLMTRIYSAEEIGIFTLIITGVNMFGGVIAGQYDVTIVNADDDNELKGLVQLSGLVTLILSLIISIFYGMYLHFTNDLSYIITSLFMFILLIIFGFHLISTSVNNRLGNYSRISKSSIFQSLTREGLIISLGLLKFSYFGLLISEVFSRLFAVYYLSKDFLTKGIFKISKTQVINLAKKYKNQVIYQVPALFANNFAYSSINIFVNYLFGASILGLYSISYRILGIPLNLVSNNVAKVYLSEATKENRNTGSYRKIFIKTSLFLCIIAVPVVIVLIFFSPWLFGIIFGDDWIIAGEYVQILAPMFGVRMIVSPLTSGIIISNKQKINLIIQSLFVIGTIISFSIANNSHFSIYQYLSVVTTVYVIIYVIYYIMLYKISSVKDI